MELKHARTRLKLHTLRAGDGPALLLLHALGGSSRDWDAHTLGWQGPVHALDLGGHGHSGRLYGGAYHASLWAADADVALAALERAVIVGAGVGGYAGLLLAGARPEQVPAVVLVAGAGLDGNGTEPDWDDPRLFDSGLEYTRALPVQRGLLDEPCVDASVQFADLDVRPTDYTDGFARRATRVVLVEDDAPRPPWWRSLRAVSGVEQHPGALSDVLKTLRKGASTDAQ